MSTHPAPSQLGFNLVLMWAMVSATAAVAVLSVLATFIIEDLSISRGQYGLLLASVTAITAVASPAAGRVTDRIGGRNAVIVVYASSALALLVFSVAPVFVAMFVGSLVGAGGAAANPSTNKLIATYTVAGRRGVAIGIKQAGPQVGGFAAGLLAPWGATTIGWRPTVVITALAAAVGIAFVVQLIPADPPLASRRSRSLLPLPHDVRWVAGYGFLIAVGGSAAFFVPLFAEEAVGLSPQMGGLAAALIGAVAILGRLAWARLSVSSVRFLWPLAIIAALSALGAAAFLASIAVGPGSMWVGAVLIGLSSSSWTSVGSLAVMSIAGAERAGQATGFVWLGFLAGLAVGPPVFGWTVDRTGSYAWMWVIALVAFIAGAALMAAWWARSGGGPQATSSP